MFKNNSFVFYVSNFLILCIVAFALIFSEFSLSLFKYLQKEISENFGWFYVLTMSIIFFVMMFLCFSKYGDIKLGPDHATPKYSTPTWLAMLFSAGMGIGIMFFGVGEPLMHYLTPPDGDPNTIEAAKAAMNITFFHWGFSPWALYGLVAIVLAFFSYRHGLPLSLRSAFFPIVGKKIYGRFGDVIDIVAVIATLLGVATSLGYGVLQINAGFNYLFGMPIGKFSQISLVLVITLIVGVSAFSGVDKGMKFLSNTNMILAILLVLFILILGDTIVLLKDFLQNTGNYLSSFVGDTFNLYAYEKKNDAWLGGWTIFYWTWWIAWSPSVGLFIAKISRGRTIREFVLGVIFVPSLFSFAWMTVFGNSAIDLVNAGNSNLAQIVNKDVALALFVFLQNYPLHTLLAFISIIMIVLFFVTSADSASFVTDMLCNRGKSVNKEKRLFWSFGIGILAAVLLYQGGLEAIQALTMIWALPFALTLLGSIHGLFNALKIDCEKKESQNITVQSLALSGRVSWKDRLQSIIEHPDKDEAKEFMEETVLEAFEELKNEFEKNDIISIVKKDEAKNTLEIRVILGNEEDFVYGIKPKKAIAPDFLSQNSYYRAEVYLQEGGQDYDVLGWSKNALINDIIEQYAKHLHYLYKVR